MGFVQGSNALAAGKIKLGSTDIDKIYFGSNFVWPLIPTSGSCAIEGTGQVTIPVFSCAIEAEAISQ